MRLPELGLINWDGYHCYEPKEMVPKREIVITGIGIVSPIGIGTEAFWSALCSCRSGVRRIAQLAGADLPIFFGAQVADFDPKRYVRPRKSLKVMSRDIQLAFAAADLARNQAQLGEKPVAPERLGIVFGSEMIPCEASELIDVYRGCTVDGRFDFSRWGEAAMAEMFPLWMLKYLPNMPACHIGIAQDARGPNNSLTLGEVSTLSAVAEAIRGSERGHADAMIAGGAGSRVHASMWGRSEVYDVSSRSDDPAAAARPFDAKRDGTVSGEGAGAFVLETRGHAEARGAKPLARVLAYCGNFEPNRNGQTLQGKAIRQSIIGALRGANLEPSDIGHINAHGNSTMLGDRIEAAAIAELLGDVPVTAPKSYFGNHGAGTGAGEVAASLLALQHGIVPPTLNYEYPDPQCPVNVVRDQPMENSKRTALVLSHSRFGQAMAVVLGVT